MNIDDLTIGQAKELASLFGHNNKGSDLYAGYIGKYVICRTRNEGVNAGRVVNLDETGVVLEDARRLHYHKPINKNISWYEGVASVGISKDSRLSAPVTKIIVEDYSLTSCTAEAEKTIVEAENHEQS